MVTSNSPAQGTLLIVEDEVDLLEILIEMLTPFCGKIITVKNGKDALAIIDASEPIHAILSDINMPQMTGFQLLATLRMSGNMVPFITLTAYGDQENMRESIRLNATDFMTKPFDRKELGVVVGKAVQQGVQIKNIEKDILDLAKKSNVSEQSIAEFKLKHQQIMTLRIDNSKYVKNSLKNN